MQDYFFVPEMLAHVLGGTVLLFAHARSDGGDIEDATRNISSLPKQFAIE